MTVGAVGARKLPAFWLRGLFPKNLLPDILVSRLLFLTLVGRCPAPGGGWPATIYFTDGAGGRYAEISFLRKCGVGFATLRTSTPGGPPLFDWGGFANLPGEVQNSVRAELFVWVLLLQRVVLDGPLVLVSDSLVNIKIWQDFSSGTKADLWETFLFFQHRRRGQVTIRWVKAHLLDPVKPLADNAPAEQDLPCSSSRPPPSAAERFAALTPRQRCDLYPDASLEDVFGNCCADALADRGAQENEVGRDVAHQVLSQIAALQRVQRRAVAVLSLVSRKAKAGDKQLRERALAMPPALAVESLRSTHKTAHIGSMVWCHVCQQARALSQRAPLLEWLRSECPGFTDFAARSGVAASQPQSLPQGCLVHIGRGPVHASHKLWRHRSVFWCDACGATAAKKPQHLRSPCPRQPSSAFAGFTARSLKAGNLARADEEELQEKLVVLG